MYKKPSFQRTTVNRNIAMEGERLEDKVSRITEQKEPITDGAPVIYTERKDGVVAAYDVRTDKFEIAVEAMDVVSKNAIAKRDGIAEMQVVKDDKPGGSNTEGESIQGTENK